MAEPTEADRAKAMLLAPHAPMCTSAHTGPACVCGRWTLWPAIAQALADERERARAPFVQVIVDVVAITEPLAKSGTYDAGFNAGLLFAASRVRRAAEETGQ